MGDLLKKIKIVKKRKGAIIPKRATRGSAGFDLQACIDENVIIKSGEKCLIPTGIAVEVQEENAAGFVFARSGLGVKYGITLSNAVGVIDSDYRGEIFVSLCNLSHEDYEVHPKDRIAQLVIMPVCLPIIEEVDVLTVSERNENGFGSTGK